MVSYDVFRVMKLLSPSPGIPALREPTTLLLEQYEFNQEQNALPPSRESLYRVLSPEQLREIYLRHGIDLLFEKALEGLLPRATIKALKQVFFEKLYRLEFGGRVRTWRDADGYGSISVID